MPVSFVYVSLRKFFGELWLLLKELFLQAAKDRSFFQAGQVIMSMDIEELRSIQKDIVQCDLAVKSLIQVCFKSHVLIHHCGSANERLVVNWISKVVLGC